MLHSGIEAQFKSYYSTNLPPVFHKFEGNLNAMATCYIHIPSPTERGGLTAKELLYARMPCYFGLQDTKNGRFLCIRGVFLDNY